MKEIWLKSSVVLLLAGSLMMGGCPLCQNK